MCFQIVSESELADGSHRETCSVEKRSELYAVDIVPWATCPKCGRHLARWSWDKSRPRFKCYVGACAAAESGDAKQVIVS